MIGTRWYGAERRNWITTLGKLQVSHCILSNECGCDKEGARAGAEAGGGYSRQREQYVQRLGVVRKPDIVGRTVSYYSFLLFGLNVLKTPMPYLWELFIQIKIPLSPQIMLSSTSVLVPSWWPPLPMLHWSGHSDFSPGNVCSANAFFRPIS